jgi:glycosyltransferase involved in cell wall biosynthesis
MHIVHINFSITLGGIDSMLVDVLNEQVKITKTTLVVINTKIHITVLENLDNKIKVVKIGRKEGSKNIFKIFKLNYVHCHNSNVVNFLFNKKTPKILTVHDVNYPVKSYHKYHRIFAISKAVLKDITGKGSYNVSLVYNGVNDALIKKKQHTTNSEQFKIIVISRLEHLKKGQDLVIRALKKIKDTYKITTITADFIGEGNSKEYLQRLTKDLKITDKINFLGPKTRNYVYNNLHTYDLLIQPSRYEGFGLTVVEAMLAKIPVLVADVDGPNEILNNGEFGYCFKNDSAEDLANQIQGIFKNYNKAHNNYIERAYKHAKINFTIEQTSLNYIDQYKELIN